MQFLVATAAVVIIAVFAGPPLLMFALFAIGWMVSFIKEYWVVIALLFLLSVVIGLLKVWSDERARSKHFERRR